MQLLHRYSLYHCLYCPLMTLYLKKWPCSSFETNGTDGRTYGRTDGWTDTRDATAHLKREEKEGKKKEKENKAGYIAQDVSIRLERPPFGTWGPWTAPRDRGMAPPIGRPSLRDVAAAKPFQFRRKNPQAHIPSLMNINIPSR